MARRKMNSFSSRPGDTPEFFPQPLNAHRGLVEIARTARGAVVRNLIRAAEIDRLDVIDLHILDVDLLAAIGAVPIVYLIDFTTHILR